MFETEEKVQVGLNEEHFFAALSPKQAVFLSIHNAFLWSTDLVSGLVHR